MIIGIPRETKEYESRVPLIPESAKKLTGLAGVTLYIEKGLGLSVGYTDAEYEKAGAQIKSSAKEILKESDIVVRLNRPAKNEIGLLKKGALHISYLDPFFEKETLESFLKRDVSAVSMEMIPRTTLAQKMDAMSSQANLAGYVAVVLAAERLNKVFPMMMTPAGTISPSRVFIIGAGVAGLQAIATAKRLGARVEAFDTRPVVEEQVQSLGAKFIKIDLGETGQTKDGYAKELTSEQLKKQQDLMVKHIHMADVVITTAQVFGRKAPRIITAEMLKGMRPGSVVVDLAVETGGNVEGSKPGEELLVDGVNIIGLRNLPGRVAIHASQMYSANVVNFLTHFWDAKANQFDFEKDDEIIHGARIIKEGKLVNEQLKKHWEL
ncbi:MAG TPA: Re/Si-specific NAD(P)(+) transhydrogenase subunit alpha [Candidatus Marinimicrobia bacterium]|nr:Re/Si-specific NAD(P)(+) transhydrogenase subunit alpha [Candidatus Neomarinimicrobiota bacterium]